MSESIPQSDGEVRAAAIVQAPAAWRQPIQSALEQASLSDTAELRDGIFSTQIAEHHRDNVLAERALALSAEAAQRADADGCAIVCDDAGSRFRLILSRHHHDRTELQKWSRRTRRELIDLIPGLLTNFERSQQECKRALPQARLLVKRDDILSDLTASRELWVLSEGGNFRLLERPAAGGILSGSFHPLHDGHRKLREVAEERLGGPVCYEMTLQNADKPPLDWLTLSLRSQQFSPGELLLTCAPTFTEKARLLPGSAFVVGWDTAMRVLERRFYPEGRLESALEKIAQRNCRFLVAARRDAEGLRTLDELTIPGRFRDLFSAIPPELFEEDISSTSIRGTWLQGESETGPPGLFTDLFE